MHTNKSLLFAKKKHNKKFLFKNNATIEISYTRLQNIQTKLSSFNFVIIKDFFRYYIFNNDETFNP